MAKRADQAKERILVFCAHNDDQVFGAGGTLAKYADEGKDIYTIIFSYGESSHPWLRPDVAAKMRVAEAVACDRILGGRGVICFGLKEGNFEKEITEKGIKGKVKKLINSQKPSKIFTHSIDDPHPDHRAVHNAIMEVTTTIRHKADVFTFDVWNPINIRKRDYPKMVVDVTGTFRRKIQAIYAHESQKLAMISLLWNVYLKAFINGLNHDVRFAEVFYKVR
ncbi:PIG-L family deacetylase [Candidatus Woesearchaeota archaeon]|nr:PIG-L family deacetylase [Candidatus Woesearchaeota archaeon]